MTTPAPRRRISTGDELESAVRDLMGRVPIPTIRRLFPDLYPDTVSPLLIPEIAPPHVVIRAALDLIDYRHRRAHDAAVKARAVSDELVMLRAAVRTLLAAAPEQTKQLDMLTAQEDDT